MRDETKLPKVVKTRENKHASGVIRRGVCHPMMTGRPGVFVAVPEDWPEPGSEMLNYGDQVTVNGTPTPKGRVWVYSERVGYFTVSPSDLTPIPQTRTISAEAGEGDSVVRMSDVRRVLEKHMWDHNSEIFINLIREHAIDGEETDR